MAEPAADARARLVHALDQAGAAVQELAPVLHQYAGALEAVGFTRAEALQLTASMQDSLLRAVVERRESP